MDLREIFIGELKKFFGQDERRINHAMNVLRYAEEILEKESSPSADLIRAVALFHDVGIKEGERLHASNSPKYQEKYGPELASKILRGVGMDESFVREAADIIGHHHHAARYLETFPDRDPRPFLVLVDADLIVNALDGDVKLKDESAFNTGAAKEIAIRIGLVNRPTA